MTAIPVPVRIPAPASGLGAALLITGRTVSHWRSQPGQLVMAAAFPLMLVLMMGGMFGGAISGDVGSYLNLLMPGMLVLTTFFGLANTMQSVINDAEKGITDRLRTMPVPAVAIIGGRVLAELLLLGISLVVLTAFGLALGWRWQAPWWSVLAGYGILALLGAAVVWLGIAIALHAGQGWVQLINIVVWPLGFLSAIFVDPATMPGWLGAIAAWNPLSWATNAVRALTGSPLPTDTHLPTLFSVPFAVVGCVALLAVAVPWAATTYRRLSR